jgi:hypothetical protein
MEKGNPVCAAFVRLLGRYLNASGDTQNRRNMNRATERAAEVRSLHQWSQEHRSKWAGVEHQSKLLQSGKTNSVLQFIKGIRGGP